MWEAGTHFSFNSRIIKSFLCVLYVFCVHAYAAIGKLV